MKAKEINQLNKAYKNRFNYLEKCIFINKETGPTLFVEYLKYLRDSIVLTEYNKESENSKVKMASIITAIAEFEAYKQTQDSQQKTFHWNNFCELLKQNMEDWLKIDDSV
jgi:hypothetical protein